MTLSRANLLYVLQRFVRRQAGVLQAKLTALHNTFCKKKCHVVFHAYFRIFLNAITIYEQNIGSMFIDSFRDGTVHSLLD